MSNNDHGREQAIAQAACIAEMITALNCDYDRLDELKDQEVLDEDEQKELDLLLAEANGCADRDEAEQRINEDPLDIEVRSDWHSVGETLEPAEYTILLCTGGPAVRIRGDLDDGTPSRAYIEYQDWGTPWTELVGDVDYSALLEYAQQFYFGE
jgi:hypothetical protein